MKVSTLLTLTLIYLFIVGGIIGLCLMQPAGAALVTLEVTEPEPLTVQPREHEVVGPVYGTEQEAYNGQEQLNKEATWDLR